MGSVAGVACAPSGNEDDGLRNPTGDEGPPNALLARVAEILGVDQQKLEDAFAQARSGVPGEVPDDSEPNMPLARVADIIGIGQQKLEDAFDQSFG